MGCCASIPQGSVGMVERCGKFQRQATPGLQFLCCILGEHVSGHVSLRVQSLDVQVETKTKDNVFLHVKVSVQYQVEADAVFDAYYRLSEPHSQITTYVYDGLHFPIMSFVGYSVYFCLNFSCSFKCSQDSTRRCFWTEGRNCSGC